MRHLKTYEDFQINENVFKNLFNKIGSKLKTLKGKAYIKLMRTVLPKSILSEIDKIVGVKESYIILELFDYAHSIDWGKTSEEEVDDFLKYFSKNQNFVASINNPDRIISSTGNKEIVNILQERGIEVQVQLISKNKPNLKNLFNKVDSLKVPDFAKRFLKVAACVVLFGMISFKLSSVVPSTGVDSGDVADLDSDDSINSEFLELKIAAEESGIDIATLESEILTSDKNLFQRIIEWILDFLGIESGSDKKVTDKDVSKSLEEFYKIFKDAETKGIEDFEPFVEETKNIVKAQISVDKNIPDSVKSSLYDKIDKCKPVVLLEDDYNKAFDSPSLGVYLGIEEHDFILIKFEHNGQQQKLDDIRRVLIHELFHLVDKRTNGKFGMSDELLGKGFWDFLKIDNYDNEEVYSKNHKTIFGKESDWKYDKDYLVGSGFEKEGENLPFHEIYAMLKVMKNDLVTVGLIDSVEDPVSPELLDEILNGKHQDKLKNIDDQWKHILPIIKTDDHSLNKFSDFLSHVVDDPNKFDNLT